MRAKIYGVGINDLQESAARSIPRKIWGSMLTRCYCLKYQEKFPTYKTVNVCEEWLTYSNFKNWFITQEGFSPSLCLDKDILDVDGVKQYSPTTCVFVPQFVNNLFMRCGENYRKSEQRLLGCTKTKYGKFESYGYDSNEGRRRYLGVYTSEFDAHLKWMEAKIDNIYDVIELYRSDSSYDARVDSVLCEYHFYMTQMFDNRTPLYYIEF